MERDTIFLIIRIASILILVPYLTISTWIFYKRSDRYPLLLYISNIYILCHDVIMLCPNVPCYITDWIVFLSYPFYGNQVILRSLFTLARFRVQQKLSKQLEDHDPEDISKWQRTFSYRGLMGAFMIALVVWLAIFVAISVTTPIFYQSSVTIQLPSPTSSNTVIEYQLHRTSTDSGCVLKDILLAGNIMVGVYAAAYILIIIVMREVKENLYLKIELVLLSLLGVLSVIVLVLPTLFDIDPVAQTFLFAVLRSYAMAGTLVISVFMPLYFARKEFSDESSQINSSIDLPAFNSSEVYEEKEHYYDEKSTLLQILNRRGHLSDFRRFLQLEFCLENLMFIEQIEELRICVPADVESRAKKIIIRYIGPKSRTPINIAGSVADQILSEANLGKYSKGMFDTAFHQVAEVLANDSYRRFKRLRKAENEA